LKKSERNDERRSVTGQSFEG